MVSYAPPNFIAHLCAFFKELPTKLHNSEYYSPHFRSPNHRSPWFYSKILRKLPNIFEIQCEIQYFTNQILLPTFLQISKAHLGIHRKWTPTKMHPASKHSPWFFIKSRRLPTTPHNISKHSRNYFRVLMHSHKISLPNLKHT